MVRIRSAPRAEAVRQGASHTIFVEGSRPETIDPTVIELLLIGTGIRVRPLGPSTNIRAAAQALHPHHPDYYFLIDRDHYSHEAVELSWRKFPDPTTDNLLIWRRR